MGCLWNPTSSRLEHKYGRNPWKMSKIGQNSMKKWPFFAIILPWMARYGSETSFLLIFSARDDLVKVSWISDARRCQNQVTLLTLTSRVKDVSRFELAPLFRWWRPRSQSRCADTAVSSQKERQTLQLQRGRYSLFQLNLRADHFCECFVYIITFL